jgi:hypothetical protein
VYCHKKTDTVFYRDVGISLVHYLTEAKTMSDFVMRRLLLALCLLVCLCFTAGPSCQPATLKAVPKALKSLPKSGTKTVKTSPRPAPQNRSNYNRGSHYRDQDNERQSQANEENFQYIPNQGGGVTILDSRGNVLGFTVPNGLGGSNLYNSNGQFIQELR